MSLTILAGKSASGKDTVKEELVKLGYVPLISYTTRPMRGGEQQDREYHFVSNEEFEKLIENGELIEHREYDTVHGKWYYGTPNIDNDKDKDYVCIKDLEGAKEIINLCKEKGIETNVYVLEASDEIRTERAKERTTSFDEEEWNRRLITDRKDFSWEKLEEVSDLIGSNHFGIIGTEYLRPDEIAKTIKEMAMDDKVQEFYGYLEDDDPQLDEERKSIEIYMAENDEIWDKLDPEYTFRDWLKEEELDGDIVWFNFYLQLSNDEDVKLFLTVNTQYEDVEYIENAMKRICNVTEDSDLIVRLTDAEKEILKEAVHLFIDNDKELKQEYNAMLNKEEKHEIKVTEEQVIIRITPDDEIKHIKIGAINNEERVNKGDNEDFYDATSKIFDEVFVNSVPCALKNVEVPLMGRTLTLNAYADDNFLYNNSYTKINAIASMLNGSVIYGDVLLDVKMDGGESRGLEYKETEDGEQDFCESWFAEDALMLFANRNRDEINRLHNEFDRGDTSKTINPKTINPNNGQR